MYALTNQSCFLMKCHYSLAVAICLFLISCGPQHKLAKQHKYMQQTYKSIKKAINEGEVTMLNDTVKVLFPEHLLFPIGSSAINQSIIPLMQRFSGALNKYDKTSILISGYTDITGGEEINKTLSQKRADTAKSLLQSFAVEPSRLYSWGMASSNPIGDNATEAGRRRNRRVEFIVLYSYKPQPVK